MSLDEEINTKLSKESRRKLKICLWLILLAGCLLGHAIGMIIDYW